METVLTIGILGFFVGVCAFACFLGTVYMCACTHDKWKLEHDRRLRLEIENAKLRRRVKALTELESERRTSREISRKVQKL